MVYTEKQKAYHANYMRTIWYPKNRKIHIARVKRLKKHLAKHLENLKRAGKCTDCGFSGKAFPSVLDYHHIRDKKFNIGDFAKFVLSRSGLEREIEKCELVCANCHRIRSVKSI
jgi:hypothetical protein